MRFEELSVKDGALRTMALSPRKTLSLEILVPPQGSNAPQVVEEIALEIHGIHDFKLALTGDPWLEVIACKRYADSEFLRRYRAAVAERNPMEDTSFLAHFEISMDGGSVDVIAESFTYRVLDSMPVKSCPTCD